MGNNKNKGSDIVKKINTVKYYLNCILENGAYSDKNYNMQMTKKSKNYNEFEKLLVTLSYRSKKLYGEKLQNELFEFLTSDKELMEYIQSTDREFYQQIQETISNGSRL